MNLVDLILGVAAISFGVAGYRQGFVMGFCAFAGFLFGGVAGIALAPKVVGVVSSQLVQAIFAVALVLTLATIGQLVGSVGGNELRRQMSWRPIRALDAGAGAVFGVLSLLVVSWFVGVALVRAQIQNITTEVNQSQLLTAVNRVMPAGVAELDASLSRLLNKNGLTRVFEPFDNERILPVPAPDAAVLTAAGVRAAEPSVVKVEGAAFTCRKALEGSGFVFAPKHVMTNAHVVAGVTDPTVSVRGTGAKLHGKVVLFDFQRDIAVIYVPSLAAPALTFDTSAARRDSAVVVGFPLDGPYTLVAARIREEINARGPDIYDIGSVDRDVFSIYSKIEPGNSGGPLLSPAGAVYGVVFAKAVEDSSETGYVLTAKEVQTDAAAGRDETAPVSTRKCV
jgi:S1-C subfamily serine protease